MSKAQGYQLSFEVSFKARSGPSPTSSSSSLISTLFVVGLTSNLGRASTLLVFNRSEILMHWYWNVFPHFISFFLIYAFLSILFSLVVFCLIHAFQKWKLCTGFGFFLFISLDYSICVVLHLYLYT
ncbi:hypothetical protein RIF29_18456 [Crotalaria pallida]|uniref:Uncharacterized protein n=1 Tax=Crotalaria pallida TaxID=3830 RepID=A0AAN9FPZ0_CROPI